MTRRHKLLGVAFAVALVGMMSVGVDSAEARLFGKRCAPVVCCPAPVVCCPAPVACCPAPVAACCPCPGPCTCDPCTCDPCVRKTRCCCEKVVCAPRRFRTVVYYRCCR